VCFGRSCGRICIRACAGVSLPGSAPIGTGFLRYHPAPADLHLARSFAAPFQDVIEPLRDSVRVAEFLDAVSIHWCALGPSSFGSFRHRLLLGAAIGHMQVLKCVGAAPKDRPCDALRFALPRWNVARFGWTLAPGTDPEGRSLSGSGRCWRGMPARTFRSRRLHSSARASITVV